MSGIREGFRGIAKNKTSKMPAFTEHTLLSWEPNDSLWGGDHARSGNGKENKAGKEG